MSHDSWSLGSQCFTSRLLLGSAQYPSQKILLDALEASGCEIVTVALRRVTPTLDNAKSLYELILDKGMTLLPNTAGCYTAKEAVLTAQLAREALGTSLIKLEVIADDVTLLPDSSELLDAATELVRDGFTVLPYTNDDPIVAQKLQDIGCAAVMPLAAPIGTGLGIRNPHNLALIRQLVDLPVIVDAGIGTASDVALAMELGCDAVLLNSAVAKAHDPVLMAAAMGAASRAGRHAFLAGRMSKQQHAQSASPLANRLTL